MKSSTPVVEEQLGIIEAFVRRVRLIWHLLRDERVPILVKAIPVVALAYVLFPIDFLPDFLVPLGQLDDIAALMLGFNLFLELAPPEIVREHERILATPPSMPQLEERGKTDES